MKMSLPPAELLPYVSAQVSLFFPDASKDSIKNAIQSHLDHALQRVEFCFGKVATRYYFDGKETLFDHLNGDHYAAFLYFLANTIFRNAGDVRLCARLFLLNKYLHGLDAYYEVQLPDIFLLIHPMATVLGRGSYSNFFVVYQRCGIGDNAGHYPTLKEHVTLHPGASIFGRSTIENHCQLAAGSLLIDRDLDANSLYIGQPNAHKIKSAKDYDRNWWR